MKILPYAAYRPAYLREVRPSGWIRTYIERQCAGLTGHVQASGYPFTERFWGSASDESKNPYATWWPYEQTGYWLDGALKCGFLAGSEPVYQQALEEIDFAIGHAYPDGFIGPSFMRDKDRWPHAVFFRAVLAQYEISQDARYLEALTRHYQCTPHPMLWDRDVTGVEIMALLYQETGDQALLEQAKNLYQKFNERFPGHDCSLHTLCSEKPGTEHGVTYNEIAKLAAILYSATGCKEYLDAAIHGYAKIERDQLLADGVHSSSEHLRGNDPLDSHETCDITDYTWALGYLLQATGQASYADLIERAIFNAAPGAVTKDFKALQYFSCPNQVIVANNSNHNRFIKGFNWMQYRPDHEVQCCPGNVHRAMPNYVSRMWLRAPDSTPQGAIVAALYGPGQLQTSAGGDNTPLTITSHTHYPFEQQVQFAVQPAKPVTFTFSLRIPAWCQNAELLINGQPVNISLQPGTFASLSRQWQIGDIVLLKLPFSLHLKHWTGGGISLHYGPLTLSLSIEPQVEIEIENSTLWQRKNIQGPLFVDFPYTPIAGYPAVNLYPSSPWNYALGVNETNLQQEAQIIWNTDPDYPFDPDHPPLVVRVPARRIKDWEIMRSENIVQYANHVRDGNWILADRQISGYFQFTPALPDPVRLPSLLSEKVEWISLIPYGATMLRMTVFSHY